MEKELKRKQDLTVLLIVNLCVIVLGWRLMEYLDLKLHKTVISIIFEMVIFVSVIIFAARNKISLLDLGLRLNNPKKTICESLTVSAILIVIGIIAKIVWGRLNPDFFPPDAPFFRWRSRSLIGYFYVVTAFFQEFLARGFLQSELHRIVEGKNKTITVLFLSALIFSVFHIHLGFVFMVAAGFLVAVLGILYERHNNIWGVFIVHYIVGFAYMHLFIPA